MGGQGVSLPPVTRLFWIYLFRLTCCTPVNRRRSIRFSLIPILPSTFYTGVVRDLALPLDTDELRHAAAQRWDDQLWESLALTAFPKEHFSPNSLRGYRAALGLLLAFLRDAEQPFTYSAFTAWLQRQEYTEATISKRLTQTRLLMAKLCKSPPQPLPHTRSAPNELGTRPYTDREVALLLKNCLPEEEIIILLALEAALTTQEISMLRYEDVDLHDAYVHLRTGSNSPVTVGMSHELKVALEKCFARAPQKRKHAHVAANTSQSYISKRVRDACQRAGVPALGLRGLRVTAGVRAFRETGDLRTVMQRLRLKSLQQAQAYAKAAALLDGNSSTAF